MRGKLKGILIALASVGVLGGCQSTANGRQESAGNTEITSKQTDSQADEEQGSESSLAVETVPPQEEDDESAGNPDEFNQQVLVVYFSATGNTEEAAVAIAAQEDAEIFQLVPTEPYTSEDLNYNNSDSRVSKERDQGNERAIELEQTSVDNWEEYDTVWIGYPIWWSQAAWPVETFVKANDFTDKVVIPFCTSASSGIGSSGTDLAELAGTGSWEEGIRFSSSNAAQEAKEYVASREHGDVQ